MESESSRAGTTSNLTSKVPEEIQNDDLSDSESEAWLGTHGDSPVDESLSSTIILEIESGTYICLVCTCEVDSQSKIWSCQECYRVYDLDCIKDWAVRGSSTTGTKRWRCPACNHEHSKIPSVFTCWCGKTTNPGPDSPFPFSCGNACNYKYPNCVHSCSSVCHPGKHPECGALGPAMKCRCGKESQQLPCIITPYESGWNCANKCDVVACALGHGCPKKNCHSGFCGPCEEMIESRCYCGKNKLHIKCSEIDPKYAKLEQGQFIGAGPCEDTLIQHYDCGVHFETLRCQPVGSTPLHCKFSPDVIEACYCGKTPSSQADRSKCTDPMPECDKVCGKIMSCGCACKIKCHEGPCECFNVLEVQCKCQRNGYLVPCKAIQDGFLPRCRLKCTASLSCKKHLHREVCCEYEQVALKRERENKRLARNRIRTDFSDQILTMESQHICTRVCSQLKLCQKHRCEALCHSGDCGICYESSNDDLVCHCGKTVVPAPVRCGTVLDCHEQCVRDKPCGHRQEAHQCHGDDKSCPRCTKLVVKKCACGKNDVKNVLCWVQKASCGEICAVKKLCGHPCNRACSSDCTKGIHARESSCQSICNKVRENCPHMCLSKCHFGANTPCDSVMCREPVVVTCGCGRLKKTVKCGATEALPTKIGSLFECDEECAFIKREEELRRQFGMAPSTLDVYPKSVLDTYRRQTAWCSKFEAQLRDFLSDYQDNVAAGRKPLKSLHLPPMSAPQRNFIQKLADVYKLYSESQGEKQNGHVFVFVTSCSALPSTTCREAITKEDLLIEKEKQLKEITEQSLDESLFNAVLIKDVFLGVSKEDVERRCHQILQAYAEIEDPEIVLIKESTFAFTSKNFREMTKEKEDWLFVIMKAFKNNLKENYIAFDCKMCLLDLGTLSILKTDPVKSVRAPQTDSNLKSGSHGNSFALLAE